MDHLDFLIVCMNADPPTSGYATRVFSMVKILSDSGYRVGALRLVPAFHKAPTWKELFCKRGVKNCYEFKIPPISRFAFLRTLAIHYGHLLTKKITKKHSVKAIQCEAHEAVTAVLGGSWPSTIKIVADIHGAAAEEADYLQQEIGLPISGKGHWLKRVEISMLKEASRVIVVSEEMKRILEDQGSTQNVVVVPIGIDDIAFKSTNRIMQRRKLGYGSEIICVYSGGAQRYQCIGDTCKIVLKLKKIIVGLKWLVLTNDKEKFLRELQRAGVSAPNDTIFLSVSREEVSMYLAAADVAFLLRKNHVVNTVSCPTKFGEYLAAGLPVVTTSFAGHAPNYIKQFGVGCIVKENVEEVDAQLLANQFKHFQDERIRANCIDVARRHLAWSEISKRVIEMYREMDLT